MTSDEPAAAAAPFDPRLRLAAVTLAYALITVVMALPFSLDFGGRVVVDAPDTHLYIWTLAWNTHAFTSQPLRIFDANIYYPYANTLAYSENLIGTAFFAAPVIWLTGNLVLAMNLAAFATCVLCGLGAYLLARRLQLSPPAAFICGLVFAFAPPRFFKFGQLHMTSVQWIPFALAYLHGYLERGRRADVRAAIGCFTLQALSSGHGAVFLALAAAALVLWRLVWRQPLAVMQRVRDIGVTGACLFAPAVWVTLPYIAAQREAGLRRDFAPEAQPGVESFLASPARVHVWLHDRLFDEPVNEAAIAFLFPGLLLFGLVGAALALRNRQRHVPTSSSHARLRDDWTIFYALLALSSAMLFASWPVEVWRFVYWLPGFNFIRVPARFMILTMLALAVLGGLGAERVLARIAPSRRPLVAGVIAVLLLAEYNAYPFASVPFSVETPAVDRWLATEPRPVVVAEVPVPPTANLGALERQQTMAMLHATSHWHRTIHGYSGIRRPLHGQLYRDLEKFPDANSLTRLRQVGVTHVIVHRGGYAAHEWPRVADALVRTPSLGLVHESGGDRVYLLLPPR